MNLLARAERGVLRRAAVAAIGIVVLLLLLTTVSRADPTCDRYNADGSCSTGRTATPSTRTGAGRPAGCPRLWCGCWARLQAGIKDPRYNLALAWLSFRHVPKQVGAWAVMRRRGGGHVGRVVGLDASGNPVIESGNHNGRVGTATYPAGRIVAYVVPRG